MTFPFYFLFFSIFTFKIFKRGPTDVSDWKSRACVSYAVPVALPPVLRNMESQAARELVKGEEFCNVSDASHIWTSKIFFFFKEVEKNYCWQLQRFDLTLILFFFLVLYLATMMHLKTSHSGSKRTGLPWTRRAEQRSGDPLTCQCQNEVFIQPPQPPVQFDLRDLHLSASCFSRLFGAHKSVWWCNHRDDAASVCVCVWVAGSGEVWCVQPLPLHCNT